MAGEILSANVVTGILKYVANTALPALVGKLVMANLVNRGFDGVTTGDTVTIPIAPTLVSNNLAEAGSVQKQAASLGGAQITLTTHAESTIAIPDAVQAINNLDLMATYVDSCFKANAVRIESDLLGLYPQLTSNAPVGTANTAITEAVLDSAEGALFTALVPEDQPRILVVNGATYSTIRQISRFTELQTIGSGNSIVTGEIMKVKNLNVIRSQYVKKVSTTTYNIAFTRDAFGLAMRRLPSVFPGTGAVVEYSEFGGYGFRVVLSYNSQTLTPQLTVDCMYGCDVIRNPFGIQVLS